LIGVSINDIVAELRRLGIKEEKIREILFLELVNLFIPSLQ